jgi:hypothetical protein
MKKLIFVTFALMLLLASGALAQDVKYNYSKDTDFTKYKTYKWVTIKNAAQVDEITAKQITTSINTELAKKGLTMTDSDSADLYIGYQTSIGTEQQITAYNTGWGYGPGWGGGWYGGGMGMTTTTATTSTIYKGQLDIDFYDAAKKELIWRGIASKTIDTKAKPDKRQKNIDKGIAKLLKDYPPKKK